MSEFGEESVRRRFTEARQRIQDAYARFGRDLEQELGKIRERMRERLETL